MAVDRSSPRTSMIGSRTPRRKPFLDDPGAYPEFSLLVERRRVLHSLRVFAHNHRAAALLLLVALCVAGSGAVMPPLPQPFGVLSSSAGHTENGDGGSLRQWGKFLYDGLLLEALADHFEGLGSAMACMLVATIAILSVYPLHRLTSRTVAVAGQNPPSPFSRFIAGCISVGLPSAIVSALAVWGTGRFRWGLASGFCVGLHCGASILKSWSFVHSQSVPASASTYIRPGTAVTTGGGCVCDGTAAPASPAVPAVDGAEPSSGMLLPSSSGVCRGTGFDGMANGLRGAVKGQNDTVNGLEGKCTLSETNDADNTAAADTVPNYLNFEEFAFFLLLAPVLVCEPRFLRREARRRLEIRAALTEIFYAALTYLAVHTTSTGLFAPILRIISAVWSFNGFFVKFDGFWNLDYDRLEALRATGGGAWLMAAMVGTDSSGDYATDPLSVEKWRAIISTAAVLAMGIFSPLMHFLLFYAFFHCVCLGVAELSGYPDRNFYGPWWLAYDHIRDYFRMWSAPVGRWLSVCIQRPLLEAGRRARLRDRSNGQRGGVSMDRVMTSFWGTMSVLLAFSISGMIHEGIGYIGMRRTFFPFNTFFLLLSASFFPVWDLFFPVVRARSSATASAGNAKGGGNGLTASTLGDRSSSKGGNGGQASSVCATNNGSTKTRRDSAVGVNRGIAAVLFCFVASAVFTSQFDLCAWSWWRHAFLSE